MRPRRHHLDEIQPPLRDRIPPDMDADPERADGNSSMAPRCRFRRRVAPAATLCTVALRVMIGVTPRVR